MEKSKDELNEEMLDETADEALHDDVDLELEEAQYSDKIKELRARLKTCEEEKMAVLENLQRAKADFLNSRRRLEEQSVADRERVTDRIVADLLPLIDSFEQALRGAHADSDDSTALRKGIEAMEGQLLAILKNFGISEIDAAGKHFNPHEHEAVSTRARGASEPGIVIEVLQKGYRRNGTVIRPAKVVTAE
jgi:molecular chaperone GrpE